MGQRAPGRADKGFGLLRVEGCLGERLRKVGRGADFRGTVETGVERLAFWKLAHDGCLKLRPNGSKPGNILMRRQRPPLVARRVPTRRSKTVWPRLC